VTGWLSAVVDATPGILVKCDPHIKTILLAIDSVNHDYIIDDLDEEHLLVKENMYDALKAELEKVRGDPSPESPRNDSTPSTDKNVSSGCRTPTMWRRTPTRRSRPPGRGGNLELRGVRLDPARRTRIHGVGDPTFTPFGFLPKPAPSSVRATPLNRRLVVRVSETTTPHAALLFNCYQALFIKPQTPVQRRVGVWEGKGAIRRFSRGPAFVFRVYGLRETWEGCLFLGACLACHLTSR